MRKRRAVPAILAIGCLVSPALAGCSKGADEPSSTSSLSSSPAAATAASKEVAPKEVVELKAYFPGDTPQGFDTVLAAVNEKLKKDNVGAKLNIQFISWADYGNLTSVKLASNEDFDMYLEAPWLHMNQMIAAGSILPLDDLVAGEPELQKSIPDQMWEANKFSGKIMGIPLGSTQGMVQGFTVRKDLRLKYGLPEIKTIDDMEKFLYTVKEKDKDLVPFIFNSNVAGHIATKFDPNYFTNHNEMNLLSLYTLYIGDDKKVHPVYENQGWIAGTRKMTQFYKDGIFEKNVAQENNAPDLFNKGKAAATSYYADGVEGMKYLDVLKNVPGAQLEVVIPAADDWKPLSTFVQGNFLSIPKSSKHADRVMDVMNWLSIKENHDLLEYGVQGTDWQPVGDSSYTALSKYSFPGYVIAWRPNLERTPDNMLPDDKKWLEFAKDAGNFKTSNVTGFTPDMEPIKTEVAKMTPLDQQIGTPLAAGVIDADKGIPMLKAEEEKAGIQKVADEIQRQFDAFLTQK